MISVTEQLNNTLVPLIRDLFMQIQITFKESIFTFFLQKEKNMLDL